MKRAWLSSALLLAYAAVANAQITTVAPTKITCEAGKNICGGSTEPVVIAKRINGKDHVSAAWIHFPPQESNCTDESPLRVLVSSSPDMMGPWTTTTLNPHEVSPPPQPPDPAGAVSGDPYFTFNPYNNEMYLAAETRSLRNWSGINDLSLWSSSDGTWTAMAPSVVCTRSNEQPDKPSAAVGPQEATNGVVYVAHRTKDHEIHVHRRNADALFTDTPEWEFQTITRFPANAVVHAPIVLIDPSDGDVYVLWVDWENNQIKIARATAVCLGTNQQCFTTMDTYQLENGARFMRTGSANVFLPDSPLYAASMPMARFNPRDKSIGIVWHERSETNVDVKFISFSVVNDQFRTDLDGTKSKTVTELSIGNQWTPGIGIDSMGNYVVTYYDTNVVQAPNDPIAPSSADYEVKAALIDAFGRRLQTTDTTISTHVSHPDSGYCTPEGTKTTLGEYQDVWNLGSKWYAAFIQIDHDDPTPTTPRGNTYVSKFPSFEARIRCSRTPRYKIRRGVAVKTDVSIEGEILDDFTFKYFEPDPAGGLKTTPLSTARDLDYRFDNAGVFPLTLVVCRKLGDVSCDAIPVTVEVTNEDCLPGRACIAEFQTCRRRVVRHGLPTGCIDIENSPGVEIESGRSISLCAPSDALAVGWDWHRFTATQPDTVFADQPQIWDTPSVDTTYWVEVDNGVWYEESDLFTVKILGDCDLIEVQPSDQPAGADGTATFTITSSAPDATFEWYRGPRGDTTNKVGTESTFQTPALADTTYYWCRVRSASQNCKDDSVVVAATVCKPARIDSPQADYSGNPVGINAGEKATISVAASGTSLSYKWFELKWLKNTAGTWDFQGETQLGHEGPSFEWTAPAVGRYEFKVRVSGPATACGGFDERRVIAYEVLPSGCPIPEVLSYFPAEVELYPGRLNPVLELAIKPHPDRPGLEDPSNLDFRWYVDGNMITYVDGSVFNPSRYVAAVAGVSITEEVWRKCAGGATSPSVRHTTFVYDPTDCTIPPLTVDQLAILSGSGNQTFTARSTWPSTTFQWYRDDSGNTRTPLNAGPSLTVAPVAGTYWVRATSTCGSTADSPTLTVTTPSCQPVKFTRHPESTPIRAKVPYTITYDATAVPPVSQSTWYRGENDFDPAGSGASYTIPSPLKTTQYWVRASNGCHFSDSKLALLQVVSCDDIGVVTQPQPDSINEGESATLSIVANSPTGSALSYQWYEGESGDASRPIAGAASLTVTPAVTTKYWLRVKASAGCEIDLPTVTVFVCRKPFIPQHATQYTTSSPGRRLWLDAFATGDQLSYQWYRGTVGDTSAPYGSGRSILADPLRTTEFWFRVTSDCHEGTPDRTADSQQVLFSVCPEIRTQPVAANPVVMPNTTTTLTIEADRGDLIQWFKGAPHDMSGGVIATGATITTPGITAETTFWALVSSGTCERKSDPVTVKLCDQPTVRWGYSTRTQMAVGESQTLYVTPTKTPDSWLTYTWYQGGEAGDVAGSTLLSGPGSTNISHHFIASTNTKFWCRVQEPTGCYADTPTLNIAVCAATITSQPQSVMIDTITNPAATATLSVGANGGPLTYQWYAGQPGDTTSPLAGKTAASLTITPAADTTYWVRVTGTCGSPQDSAAATVTLCKAPQITSQPPPSSIKPANVNTTLAVFATGTDLTYQWYEGTSGTTTKPITGATASSVIVSPMKTTDYWVRVSGRCGASQNSTTAKISIAPVITSQPVGGYVMSGLTRTLTVAATGEQLSYQWYSGSTTIGGATSASYTTPAITANASYWVRVWSGGAQTDSAVATFTVCTQPTIRWNTVKTLVAEGETQTLYVTATGSSEFAKSYTWYSGDSGNVAGSTLLSGPGATNISLTITSSANPTQSKKYWCRISESNGCYADTTTLEVKVCVPTITTQPQSIMINQSTSTTLSVAANGGPLTYQWYIGDSGAGTMIAGATSASLNVTPAAETKYWVRVSGNCGVSSDSNTATVSICQPPQITQNPFSVSQSSNVSYTLGVAATGTDLTYQWYAGVSGNTSAIYTGATSPTLQVSPANTTDYWVKVSGRCGSMNSTTAKISVYPTITTQPAGGPITKGTTRTLTVAASGTQLRYEWFLSPSTTPIAGAAAASYITPAINADATYYARVWSGNASTDSAQATLAVCQPRSFSVSNSGISGASVTFTVTGAVAGESFEWYRGESGVTSAPVGTGTSLTLVQTATSRYWLRTKRTGCDADSAAVTVRSCQPAITSQPQSALIITGSTRTLSVTATGTPALTYQWYTGDSGVTSSPITGATASSYTTLPLSATTKYWVRVSSPADAGCGVTYTNSATATISVCRPPAITSQMQSYSINWYTDPAPLTIQATGDNLSYQWYQGTAGVTTTPVGENANSIVVYPGTTKSYWVRITGTCGVVDSAVALISVKPWITSYPKNVTTCKGSMATASVTAQGDPLSYAWYRYVSGTAGNELIGTARTVSFVVTGETEFWCIVTSGNATASTGHNFVTLLAAPTIESISKQSYNSSYYKLTANIDPADVPYASFVWYQGALGNTTYQAGWDQMFFQPKSSTSPYWVRVTRNDTGCWTDKAAP